MTRFRTELVLLLLIFQGLAMVIAASNAVWNWNHEWIVGLGDSRFVPTAFAVVGGVAACAVAFIWRTDSTNPVTLRLAWMVAAGTTVEAAAVCHVPGLLAVTTVVIALQVPIVMMPRHDKSGRN